MSEELRPQVTEVDASGALGGEVSGISSNDEPVKMQLETPKKGLNIPGDPVYEVMGLVCVLRDRFQETENIEDAKNMIRCVRLAILLTSDDHSEDMKPMLFSALAGSYLARFQCSGQGVDLNSAIGCWSRSLSLTPASRPPEASVFDSIGDLYLVRLRRQGVRADMDYAIQYFTQAVSTATDTPDEKPGRLVKLAGLHKARFGLLGEILDIDKAIAYEGRAVFITDGDTTKADYLGKLADSHHTRFGCLGELVDIDKATECHEQAVVLTLDGHPSKPSRLGNLGTSYGRRFMRLGMLVDLNKAIDCHNQALVLVPDGHETKPALLCNLGNSLEVRFQRFGNIEDANKALDCQNQALKLTPDAHPDKPGKLTNLGNSYWARYTRLSELMDLETAIDCHNQAVLLVPDSDANKPIMLSNLGGAYQSRFERLGMLVDINKAIDCLSRAALLVRDGSESKLSVLNNLGNAYRFRFQSLGELGDIDKAIECQSQAVLLTPDDHANKPIRLNNLGYSYRRRFRSLVELADLNKAVDCHARAVFLIPDDHAAKPPMLDNLGVAYQIRFNVLGALEDLDKAIENQRQAVLLTADGRTGKACMLSNVGNSYKSRFERLGELADLDKAIDYHTQAVRLTPEGHADKAAWLGNLGSSLMGRFQRLGEPADADKAIDCMDQTVSLIPDSDVNKSQSLFHLGFAYKSRFERLGKHSDLVSASTSLQRAAQCIVGRPYVQLGAAREWARLCLLLEVSPLLAHQRAMELVPRVIWLGATVDQRYKFLAEIGDVAIEAAAWAISVNAYDTAIKWLEQGRSVVWNQILTLRSTFCDLSAAHPELAQQLEGVGRQLEYAGSRSADPSFSVTYSWELEKNAQQHRRLAAEWDHLLDQAREVPGFQDIVRPRKIDELMHAAKNGPVVVVNVHWSRCDALIIQPSGRDVAHVPLKNFTSTKAAEVRTLMVSLVGQRGGRAGGFKRKTPELQPEEMFKGALAMLWLDVVQPVLNFLGYTRRLPIEDLPRIIWCTTGALSFLPLHAAGCYDDSQPNAFDLVVSSYTPTLSALLSPTPLASSTHAGLLAVGQEHTDGLNDLPNVVHELAAIKSYAQAIGYLQLEGNKATIDEVLKGMEQHSWVHLACHAVQNIRDPVRSGFHLCDGTLALAEIMKKSFSNKGLAFLSACQTATGDERLPDEAVHLAAGMLMAGYPSVIATMWSIDDEDAPEVAKHVYAAMLKDGKMDCSDAARALHGAVANLREKVGKDSFRRWVPFIYIGL